MDPITTLIHNWLAPLPEALRPYIFFAVAAGIIVITLRVIRGVILAVIAGALLLLTLYLSSQLFGIPLRLN